MKPETRLDRALFAARLRAREGKDRTLLSTEATDDVCAELLAVHLDVVRLERQAEEQANTIAVLRRTVRRP